MSYATVHSLWHNTSKMIIMNVLYKIITITATCSLVQKE